MMQDGYVVTKNVAHIQVQKIIPVRRFKLHHLIDLVKVN